MGLTVTSAKIYMLSLGAISRSVWLSAGIPSTLILKRDWLPCSKYILDILILSLCGLYTFRIRVAEPSWVKTVSKRSVSVENEMLSSGFVVKRSFRHADVYNAIPISNIDILKNKNLIFNVVCFFTLTRFCTSGDVYETLEVS